jgi:hypothetical protein
MTIAGRIAAAALLIALGGCSARTKESASSAYLIIDSLLGVSGAKPDSPGSNLASDVLTFVPKTINGQQVRVPTIFEDLAQVTFRLGMKDPGTVEAPSAPTTSNYITVNRFRVTFLRSDGRNTPGVDVPYGFDGAMTVTVGGEAKTSSFTLVRIQAKNEAPLRSLVGGEGAYTISAIAQITFYGTDQTGREVSVSGQLSVNFADWGDPT